MGDGLYLATNPGAALRRMFPKQLNSPFMIIIWGLIFMLNIVAVILVQYNLIYNITEFSKDGLQTLSYFENCEIITMEDYRDKYIIYQNEKGEKRVARLEMFPGHLFERAKIDKSYDRIARGDGSIELKENILDNPPWVGAFNPITIMYLILGSGMLLIEFCLYEIFHRLFRE